jgi:signal transduction histidine kinase
MRLSVTARIALLAIALALVSNLVLVGFVWKRTHDDAIAATRREMIEQSDALLAIWTRDGDAALADAVRDARPPGDVSLVVAVLDPVGRRRIGYAPPRVEVPLRATSFRVGNLAQLGGWGVHDTGYILRPIGAGWLLTGRNLDVIEAEQRAIESALALAVTLSLALGIGAGLVVARYVGARLNRIAGVVEAAGQGDLSRRVQMVAGGNDSFDRLAARLNAMLGKVEQLMGELRVVTDSVAHDLRSPLARLRTKAELAVTATDPAARDAALGGLLAETDLVMRMLTMVIEISRSEAVSRDRFTRVEPAALVEEIADLYEPVAEEAGVDFTVAIDDRPSPLPLHRELLSQAIANLLDNALKHGAGGGAIVLRLGRAGDGIAIGVEDRGPGIAAHDREQALKRFGRLDSARSTPGAGLGLALIDAVARLHGGRFELADNAPGLIARIVLPD